MKNVFLFAAIFPMMFFSAFSFIKKDSLIPRAVLFGNPEKAQPQISPDGEKIAYLAPHEGVLNIWIRPREGGSGQRVTDFKDRGITNFFWAKDSSHLFFMRDRDGDENTHLYVTDPAGGGVSDLTPFADTRVQVLAYLKKYPGQILLAMNRDNPKAYDAWRLDWQKGEWEIAAKNPGNVSGWIADMDLKVRGALSANPDGGYALKVRPDEKSPWREETGWGFDDNFNSYALGFSEDGKSLYLIDSREAPAGRLVEWEIGTGRKKILAEDPDYDVAGTLRHPETGAVQMAAWQREKREWQILDKSLLGDVKRIQQLHPGVFSITSRDAADRFWILRIESDILPADYYLYDRKTQTSRFLFTYLKALKKYKLAQTRPVSFTARDGLKINGYLTLPHGAKPGRRWPLVLKVHGGPWSRDTWNYDSRVQWLANRGYACLQVNYRGSTSYGKAFLNAGNREWGGKMQNDLTDAVKWAVKEGIADPERTAIFGGSYGGYAALAGAVWTPDLYRAAIAFVGPSNLLTFIRSIPPYWTTELVNIYKRIGNPDTDEEFLKSRSPLFAVENIRIPMLIAQGANDPRVKKAESEQIVDALKEHGIPHKYLLFPDEGHGFGKPENQIRFYKEAEAFLAKHLGGRAEK